MTSSSTSHPQPATVTLPPPDLTGGLPLMQALQRRASSRRLAAHPLPERVLSDLLWAANGVNRPDTGKRTAPSAMNWQEVAIYIVLPEAAYRYDPAAHALMGVVAGNLRRYAGVQDFVAQAPAVLVYVVDLTSMPGADEDGRHFYPACDTGYVSQNVYLYCASAGLATVALISVDKPELHQRLGLAPRQLITLTQPVGYPGEDQR